MHFTRVKKEEVVKFFEDVLKFFVEEGEVRFEELKPKIKRQIYAEAWKVFDLHFRWGNNNSYALGRIPGAGEIIFESKCVMQEVDNFPRFLYNMRIDGDATLGGESTFNQIQYVLERLKKRD